MVAPIIIAGIISAAATVSTAVISSRSAEKREKEQTKRARIEARSKIRENETIKSFLPYFIGGIGLYLIADKKVKHAK